MFEKLKSALGFKPPAPVVPPVPVPVWADSVVEVGDFEKIQATGLMWVQWVQGSGPMSVTIDQDDQAKGGLNSRVEDGVLILEVADNTHPVRVKVASNTLSAFKCFGAAAGAAMAIKADIFEGHLENGQRLLLTGEAVAMKLSVAGSGHMQADGFIAHSVQAKVTSTGYLEAKAESIAEAVIGGGGEIMIYGNPSVSKIERVGPGRAKVGSKVSAVEPESTEGIFGQMPLPRQ